jgi:pimeloyl-ACP methyl ester carboxylesterase
MDIEEALMVIELADALHYDPCAPFVLVGHSRGCSVATACAAGFPDRVCALVTFESAYGLIGSFPMNQGVAATTGNHKLELVLAADRAGLARGKRTRVFESLQAAIDHNHRNKRFAKAAHTSENIVRRHVHQVPNGGWQLTHDPRLYVQTQPIYSDELVCRSVLRGLRCNTINVRASNFRDRWRKIIRNEASGEQWSKIAVST